jgi:hypothetical protein
MLPTAPAMLPSGDVVTTSLLSTGSGRAGVNIYPLTVFFTAQYTVNLSTNLSHLAAGMALLRPAICCLWGPALGVRFPNNMAMHAPQLRRKRVPGSQGFRGPSFCFWE